jgi:hypothetical protein
VGQRKEQRIALRGLRRVEASRLVALLRRTLVARRDQEQGAQGAAMSCVRARAPCGSMTLMKRALLGVVAFLLACSGSESPGGETTSDTGAVAQDSTSTGTDTTTSDDTATTTTDSSTTSDSVVADASDTGLPVYGPYPPGPYGNKVGDVFPNLKWRGFVNEKADGVSTTKPIVDTSLDALRRTARKPYALLHASEFT